MKLGLERVVGTVGDIAGKVGFSMKEAKEGFLLRMFLGSPFAAHVPGGTNANDEEKYIPDAGGNFEALPTPEEIADIGTQFIQTLIEVINDMNTAASEQASSTGTPGAK